MVKVLPGLIIGSIFTVGIFLSQVVFPNPNEDNVLAVLLVYLLLFFSFYATGFWYKKTGGKGGGIRIGIITAIIVFLMVMGTYFLVDNVYLDIVSHQNAKIWGFANSSYRSMRDYINAGLVRGLIAGLPLAAILGGVFGGMGGVSAVYFSRRSNRKPYRLWITARSFMPYAAVITLAVSLMYAAAHFFQKTEIGMHRFEVQLISGWIFSLCAVLFTIIIAELLYRSERNHKK